MALRVCGDRDVDFLEPHEQLLREVVPGHQSARLLFQRPLEPVPRETGSEPSVTFEVLRDRGNEAARRYGIVHTLPADLQAIYAKFNIDLPTVNGDGSWTLPIPARFVIDRTGIVRSMPTQSTHGVRSLNGRWSVLRDLSR